MTFFDPAKIQPPIAIDNFSATQMKTFEMCERKWALEYLHKLRAPPSSSMQMGSALHKQIENWYLLGIEPPAPLARAALRNLPQKGSGLLAIEKPLTNKDAAGKMQPVLVTTRPWVGFIDLLFQPLGETKVVQIYDHKTTKSLNWAKEGVELKTDIQMNVYAKFVFTVDPQIEIAEVFHNYLVTSSFDQTELRGTTITREENARVWEKLESRTREMAILQDMALERADPNFWQRATPNPDSCSAFGGCPFRNVLCKFNGAHVAGPGESIFQFDDSITTPTSLVVPLEKNKMALSDILKAKVAVAQAKTAAPAATTAPAAPPAAVQVAVAPAAVPAPAVSVKPNALAAVLAARKAAGAATVAGAGVVATGPETAAPAPKLAQGVLPPDAPVQGPGIALPPDDLADDLTADPAPAQEAQAPASATEAPKRGRGRPKKADAAPEAAQAAPPAPSPLTVEQRQVLGSIAQPEGFTLCIGCAPVMTGSPAVALEFVVANLLDNAAKQMNLANIHQLDYAKKASTLTELLKKYDFTAPVYTFTSNDAFVEGILLQVLSTKAALIIRGVR